MIDDHKRREVARKLRVLEVNADEDGEFYDSGEVENVLGLFTDDGAWYEAAGVRRLADLIEPEPERTCMLASMQLTHHAPDGNRYHTCRIVCSECKHDMPEHGESINYCPFCGAKVVG